jgi:flagellar motility protein MotE (MotC chaperone)
VIGKPSLLMMTAAAASFSTLAQGVSIASEVTAPKTRLGSAITQDMGRRDQDAARRARTLDLREKAARATEERIKADLAQREQAESTAAAAPAEAKGASEADQFEELARIYQAMKPAKAAIVFVQLEMDVQMKVAQKMRERSTAMILASMTPKGAAALSMALARRGAPARSLIRPMTGSQSPRSAMR